MISTTAGTLPVMPAGAGDEAVLAGNPAMNDSLIDGESVTEGSFGQLLQTEAYDPLLGEVESSLREAEGGDDKSAEGEPVGGMFASLLPGVLPAPMQPAAPLTSSTGLTSSVSSVADANPATVLRAADLPMAGLDIQPARLAAEDVGLAVQDVAMPGQDGLRDGSAQDLAAQSSGEPSLPGSESRAVPTALLSLTGTLPRETAQARLATPVEWAPLSVVAEADGGKPQALQQLLAERLAVQSSHGIDRALIRLDPPRFGALEIALQQEGGRLTVQLSATHGEVVRQLQGIGDLLRQELGQRQFQSVQVDIRHGTQDGQQQGGRQQQEQQSTPGRALQLDEDGQFAVTYSREDAQA